MTFRRLLLSMLTAALCMTHTPQVMAAGSGGIAVVVNQGVITKSDVADRINLISTSTGMPQTPELIARLRPQIVEMLIDEEIKLQEARRLKIEVTKEEIDGGFAQIAQQNGIPVDNFRAMLRARGIRLATLEDQIRSQLAWGKIIQKRMRPQVEISEADIDTALNLLRAKIGKTEYLVADIFLPVDAQKKASEVGALATRLSGQLRQQPELFPRVAQQFSQSPGAAQGGMIGWISEGQLPPEIDQKLPSLDVNQVSEPVKTMTGYHILLVRDKRQMTEETLPKREELVQRLGTERLDRLQRRYMMDLRSSAYIETRA